MINEKKVCFIMCCNHPWYQKECSSYLTELEVPEGYETEIVSVIGAKSMTAGYNRGMEQSDAKYKVYLHQDVMIWNRRFIYDMLEVFESDSRIGMLGVLGGNDIPDDGALYRAWNEGVTYACDTQDAGIKQGRNPLPGTCQEVEAIDGMLMATQYDLPWREDLFDGWDFYDVSQSFEFRKAGYSVVIPHQDMPWCMHDCGRTKLQNYNQGRKILLEEYASFFKNPVYREEDFSYNQELKRFYEQLKHGIIRSMEQGELKSAVQLCEQYDDSNIMDSDLSVLKKTVTVCDTEQQFFGTCRTWKPGETYEAVLRRYHQAKFLLWDAERERNNGKDRLREALRQELYSMPFLTAVGIHNTWHFEALLPVLAESARERSNRKDLDYLEFIAGQISLPEPVPFQAMRMEMKTEEEIAEIEQICQKNARIRTEELPRYRRRINELLKEGDRESLSELLASQEFYSKFETVTDMAYMMLASQIYQEETAAHAARTIFDGHNSIEEVVAFIQELKFGLWRLEFDMEENAGIWLSEWIRQNQISACLLKYAVHVAGMNKVILLERLGALFLEQNMLGMAFAMLKYADELLPGTEEILCTMADLCLQAGKKEEALHCLNQVKEPTHITEAFRKLCES